MSAHALPSLVPASPHRPEVYPKPSGRRNKEAALLGRVHQVMSAPSNARFDATLRQLEAQLWESIDQGEPCDRVAPSQAAIEEATALLRGLPAWVPPPFAVVEPSRAIGLEWDLGPDRFFVLAVDGTGRLEYSAILGPENDHFRATPLSAGVPKQALDLLAELIRS